MTEIVQFKHISIHLRNEAFKPNVLLMYCDKPLIQLRKMDNNIRNNDNNSSTMNMKKRYNANVSKENQFDPFPADPHANEEVQYKNYNVYTGSFQLEESDKVLRPFEDISLMTCSGYERIIQFTDIPKKIVLSTKISKTYFQDYISNILQKPNEYKYLTGWITYKRSHNNISAYLNQNECVASQQYSDNCKVFIFLVNFIHTDWLASIPIYTTTAKIEMMYILVYKKKSDISEMHISPKQVPLTSMIAYRFVTGSSKIGLKQTNLDKIRETSKPALMDSFGDRFNDGDDDEDTKKVTIDRSSGSKKLQLLIDKGDQIKKVPTSLIEEEARIERNKLLDHHQYEEESIEDDEPMATGRQYSKMQYNASDEMRYTPYSNIAGIDKYEFVRNAVNQIKLPNIHVLMSIMNYR